MKCLVTGAAGFIGSHLCERLLELGNEVTGLDAFIPYYDSAIKERNIARAVANPRFHLCRADLRTDRLQEAVAEAEVIYHLAAMPGLPRSWTDFEGYSTCNELATHNLLEAVRTAGKRLQRFLYISTSSVYGRFCLGDETLPTKPISPYGVTKLAAEHLCRAYADAFDLPLVVLRYFSIYGPRQRPDMGYFRFIAAVLRGEPLTVYGDGQQVRGNTYVSDCVAATIAAAKARPGELFNVGGGETANVWDVIHRLEAISGGKATIQREPARPGDQRYTFADTTRIRSHLGWEPQVNLETGLALQWDWQKRELSRT